MIDFTTAIKQGRLTRMGYCSLCGIEKADTGIGNRKVCSPCKNKWGITPAPPMQSVIAAEQKAVAAYEAKFGEL